MIAHDDARHHIKEGDDQHQKYRQAHQRGPVLLEPRPGELEGAENIQTLRNSTQHRLPA
jgi:hypothetical protein